jgi:hypothetical protein
MDDTGQHSRPHRMPLSEIAKLQPYEPIANGSANPVLKEQSLVAGDFQS